MYELHVNDAYIDLMHKAVSQYLEQWPGGDPQEQQALIVMMGQLDKLKLEVLFDNMQTHDASSMERGAGHWRITMTDIQMQAQKQAQRQQKLVYRGIAYLKKETR